MFKLKKVYKEYQNKDSKLIALNDVNLDFPDKGLVFIVGKSGSGKSTLLNILGGLERPTSGKVTFKDKAIDDSDFRKYVSSFVFQDFNLLYDLSLKENLAITGEKKEEEIDRILNIVGLINKKGTKVRYLSGGEKQRLAIARALAKKFDVMLLDEPTGNLDSKNSETVFNLIKMISLDKLVLTVTHDYESALKYGDYLIEIHDGFVSEIKTLPKKVSVKFKKDKFLPDELLTLYEYIPNDQKIEITFSVDASSFQMIVKKDNFLSNIVSKMEDIEDEKEIEISLETKSNIEKIEFEYLEESRKAFSFLFQCKYALSLIFKSKVRLMITFLLLTITTILLFIQTSLISYNLVNTLDNAISQNKDMLYSVTTSAYDEKIEDDYEIYKGKYLYELLEGKSPEKIIGSISNNYFTIEGGKNYNLDSFIHLYDDNFKFDSGYHGKLPKETDEIMITDFMAQYTFGTEDVIGKTITFKMRELYSRNTFKISGVIKTNYKEDKIVSLFSSSKYPKLKDSLTNNYMALYLNKDHYKSILANSVVEIAASNFLFSDMSSSKYETSKATYAMYNSQEITHGSHPNNDNEIVLTTGFLEIMELKPEEVLNKEFSYQDMSDTTKYEYIDFSSIFKKVKVVGISNDRASVLVSEDFMDKIIDELYYVSIDGFSIVKPDKNEVKVLVEKSITFKYDYLKPVYSIAKLVSGPFGIILLSLEIAFILIAALSLAMYCYANIKEKKKEIAIMKSLGITDRKISSIFYIQNGIQTLTSWAAGTVLSFVCLFLLNRVFSDPEMEDISYNLFVMESMSFYVSIGVLALIVALTTTIPLRNINKMDIVLTMKNDS
ncbi:MAG: ATP-binding cassette domain-containing protein [Candidatus Phytoplasma sp.]|nr:ATP-binding cassette domain-containing protein [Phytoplasma sp.]